MQMFHNFYPKTFLDCINLRIFAVHGFLLMHSPHITAKEARKIGKVDFQNILAVHNTIATYFSQTFQLIATP